MDEACAVEDAPAEDCPAGGALDGCALNVCTLGDCAPTDCPNAAKLITITTARIFQSIRCINVRCIIFSGIASRVLTCGPSGRRECPAAQGVQGNPFRKTMPSLGTREGNGGAIQHRQKIGVTTVTVTQTNGANVSTAQSTMLQRPDRSAADRASLEERRFSAARVHQRIRGLQPLASRSFMRSVTP